MTYVIAEPCVDVMDQACVAVCPVDCIHFEEGVDRTLYIDPDECIDCGACEPECPTAAIFPEDSVPGDQAKYTELNALWFQDKDAARAMLNEIKPACRAALIAGRQAERRTPRRRGVRSCRLRLGRLRCPQLG